MSSLFDFDFEEQVISDTEVEEVWELFRLEMKNGGNYYNEKFIVEKCGLQKYVDAFVKKDYMKYSNDKNRTYSADRSKLIYHTVDEILEEFEGLAEEFIKNPSSDYKGSASWLLKLPCDMAPTIKESQKLKGQIYDAIRPISKRIAIELGVDYYLSNPGAKGTKMDVFSDKAYKKVFLPYFIELATSITDYDELYDLLKNHSFVVGRDDWFSYVTTPRLRIEKPTFSDLDIAVLCQTSDVKVIKDVLAHCGKSMGGTITNNPKLIYPPTYTYQDYISSLTIEDCANIIEDVNRLRRLYDRSYTSNSIEDSINTVENVQRLLPSEEKKAV